MENYIAWISYTQEIRTLFASNSKFGISLNKIFVSKNFLVIFGLLFTLFSSSERFLSKPDKFA